MRLRRVMLVLLGIYLFVYPWSILLVSFDLVPVWGTWMGSALLIVQGSLMGLWLSANYGRLGMVASLIILIVSWLVEHIGTTTGLPFGSYSYTDVLLPKIVHVVPLAIPFAWLLVVPAALGITEYLLRSHTTLNVQDRFRQWPDTNRTWLRIFGAASFAVLLDITIEPVSVHVNGYWVWNHTDGLYYGVPVSNFVAWWATSFLLAWVVVRLQQAARDADSQLCTTTSTATGIGQGPFQSKTGLFGWLPSLLYMLNLVMFMLVNIAHGQRVAAFIGSVIFCYLAFDWLRPYIVQRRLETPEQGKPVIMKDER